jgi:hypothetical protein
MWSLRLQQRHDEGAMNRLPQELLSVCPLGAAALLLLARQLCEHLGLPAPDVAQILAATGASRSAAYEHVDVLAALLPTTSRPRGRPPKVVVAPAADEDTAITRAVLAYVKQHPGCARAGSRQGYSDGFRRFVVELREAHAALDLELFSRAVDVPLGTIKDWLRAPTTPLAEPSTSTAERESSDEAMGHIKTVLTAYELWSGTFVGFCEHLHRDLHVPFGCALVARILEVHGARRAKRRGRNTRDELALRGAFRTFFPGAQWVGDGKQVQVTVDGQRFTFNLELNVDAHTSAHVGVSVRDEEDAAAVVEAFSDGVATTGTPPTALLLDNKPANHAPDVHDAIGDTVLIRATPARPQNKAHCEGAFGLFSQMLPALVLDTQRGAHDVARALLVLVVTVWARTTNHRPRASRGDRSRVQLYAEVPAPEQVEQARRELRAIAEQQERARRTLEARRRPEVLALLYEHFTRLALLDPEHHIRLAIAAYPMNAIVDGIAIFVAKRRAATLPEGADARYLLGIVRNIAAKSEGEHLARIMLELRLAARDRMLASLVTARDAVCAGPDVALVCAACVDHALASTSPLDRIFWLGTLADQLLALTVVDRHARFLAAARRINATFAVSPRERQDAVRIVADRLVPIT